MPEGNFPGLTIANTKRERTLGHSGSKGLPTSGNELKGGKKATLSKCGSIFCKWRLRGLLYTLLLGIY